MRGVGNVIDKVTIGCVTYEVHLAEKIEPQKEDPQAWRGCGEIVYPDAIIYIEDAQASQVKVATLWHEIVHGLLFGAGQYEANGDEGLVNALAYGLVDLLRRNPDLVVYTLQGKGEDAN
jgi:hypothetical protein